MSMFEWDDIELPAVSTPRKKPKTLKFGAVLRLTEHKKMPTTEMDELPTPAKHNPRFAKRGHQPRPSQKAARITN